MPHFMCTDMTHLQGSTSRAAASSPCMYCVLIYMYRDVTRWYIGTSHGSHVPISRFLYVIESCPYMHRCESLESCSETLESCPLYIDHWSRVPSHWNHVSYTHVWVRDIGVMSPMHRYELSESCPESLESCPPFICMGTSHWSHVPYAYVRVIGVMSRVIGVMSRVIGVMSLYRSLKSCPE